MALYPSIPIIDLTDRTPTKLREKTRDRHWVDAVVLHQVADDRGSEPTQYLNTVAHFVVTRTGKVIQLHPILAHLSASNAFNDVGVAVEFAGHYPNDGGDWWTGNTARNRGAQMQIEAGRELVKYLQKSHGIEFVFAHRQGYIRDERVGYVSELRQGTVPFKHSLQNNNRSNCPGPDIWYGVGEWAIKSLGLSNGGTGYALGDGDPIPPKWRSPMP